MNSEPNIEKINHIRYKAKDLDELKSMFNAAEKRINNWIEKYPKYEFTLHMVPKDLTVTILIKKF